MSVEFAGVVIPKQESKEIRDLSPYELGQPLPTHHIDYDADPVIVTLFDQGTQARLTGDIETQREVEFHAERYATMIGAAAIVPMIRRGKLMILSDFYGAERSRFDDC